jgi:putative DNA primase/helicase
MLKGRCGAAHVASLWRVNQDESAYCLILIVAAHFALFAAAGELATKFGITGWPEGEAFAASADGFRVWHNQRGGNEPAEVLRGIAQLRAFIGRHGSSRFLSWDQPDGNVRERAGFWRDDPTQGRSCLFYPDAFREACAGLDPSIVARALADRGMLESGSEKVSDPAHVAPPRFGPELTR